jgi:arginine decarboxylase
MLLLTNCTFDGVVYNAQRVMEECLAIKPDLVFLWDEAWFAFARFHPVYRPRTAMRAARTLIDRLRLPEYRVQYDKFADEVGAIDAAEDQVLLGRRLLPDPARARVRVYSTQSTHKTLTSLRQGSMIHVTDQDFSQKAEETFHEAYMTHTSTSPNYQILASLDLGRRQAALEGFELVQKQLENAMRLRDAVELRQLGKDRELRDYVWWSAQDTADYADGQLAEAIRQLRAGELAEEYVPSDEDLEWARRELGDPAAAHGVC